MNMNSQVINSLNSSKMLEIKEILVRPRQLVSTPGIFRVEIYINYIKYFTISRS